MFICLWCLIRGTKEGAVRAVHKFNMAAEAATPRQTGGPIAASPSEGRDSLFLNDKFPL
jgi:hypothetical protein